MYYFDGNEIYTFILLLGLLGNIYLDQKKNFFLYKIRTKIPLFDLVIIYVLLSMNIEE